MTKIKICGLRREQDIRYANELMPDYIGFVFLKGKMRYVTFEEAARLRSLLDPAIPAVGVFVNEPAENVIRLLQSGTIQIAQLHGQEDEAYIEELRRAGDHCIIRAFAVRSSEDIHRAFAFPADYPLLDNGKGTGETFDWSLFQEQEKPFFLAGGLSPENVKEAIECFHPYAVDVSSGVETDGFKDYEKMKAFMDAVRR
ncbi:phosphoribosylanthranilate isomerase [Suilimivivens sp.]|uniref:phosphoribosylanthranilate isomerase n=1 Tax=Suilimivivens sp. TaxID=2981669 RepID=UPI0030796CCC